MLSRVAENIYWMSRNIERAENIARVLSVNTNLQLDLPRGITPDWQPLIDVVGANDDFEKIYNQYSERNVVRFLLAEAESASSVRACLTNARENCRTVRDIMPREIWRYLTELQIFLDEHLNEGLTRRGRQAFLDRIMRTCQMSMGLMSSGVTRDVGYQFMRLGRNLERADMTSRFIGMRLAITQTDKLPDDTAVTRVQWVNVLGSLSAYHMYRRKMQATVKREHVLWFLFNDDEFPRSILHCINAIEESIGMLAVNRPCLLAVRAIARAFEAVKVENLDADGLDKLVNKLQRRLIDLHNTIARMYFLPTKK